MRAAILLVLAAGCGSLEAGGSGADAAVGADPLAVDDAPEAGSFDDLHRRILAPRCSGQPGLCHNGQFEPNLSTPALAFEYLVARPAIEKPTLRRVDPGDPDLSVLIDKLRGRDVTTQMPLGAEPLDEEEIAELEAWIDDGARRRPGDAPTPVLNEPPRAPEIGIYDDGGTRLDVGGAAEVTIGQTITLRHSVRDFETADASIPFGAMVLNASTGGSVVLVPLATEDPHVAPTAYDAAGPMGQGDLLNWRFTWTIPATVEIYDEEADTRTPRSASGLILYPIAVYVDSATAGIAAVGIGGQPIEVQ
jgi:hypothetical protein